jgi:hypothetical protein
MGNTHHKVFKSNKKNRKSNCCVLDMPLDKNNSSNKINSFESTDIKQDLKNKIKLHKENDLKESEGIILDGTKSEEIKNYIFSDEKGAQIPDQKNHHPNEFRSKSYVLNPNIKLFNAPKPKIKVFDEHISPFKLCTKNFGGSQWKNKKPNSIILDFQKNLMDNKSCNDNQNEENDLYDEMYLDLDTDRETPDVEDLKDLNNCRKKMAIFRDSIDNKSEHSLGESEIIEDILSEKKNKKNKKNGCWVKYIRQQMQQSKISNKLRISTNVIKKSETLKNKNIEENELFILGVLESAAKDKKKKKMARYTANV